MSEAQVTPPAETETAVASEPRIKRRQKTRVRSDEKIQLRLTITPSMGAWRVLKAGNDEDRRFLAYTLLEYGTDAKEGLRNGGFAARQPAGMACGQSPATVEAAAQPAANPTDPIRTEEVPSDVTGLEFGDFAVDPPILATQ